MPNLRITVEWLDGIYHGDEWPPSPLRMYQAMIAGYTMHRASNPNFDLAMRHLESLPTPVIYAPEFESMSPVKSAVPNNDGDRVLDLFTKGMNAKARQKARKLLTVRLRSSRSFKGVVVYEWEASTETAKYLSTLETIASSVSAVGQGIDVAIAHAEIVESTARPKGIKFTPSSAGRRKLKIPYPGVFEVLELRHQQFRSRVSKMMREVEPAHKQSGYQSELDLPPIRLNSFALRDIEDRTLVIKGTRTVEIVTMVRQALIGAARRAGFSTEEIAEFIGYRGLRRIQIQPLPNVGYRYADGLVRRVMLTADGSFNEEIWQEIMSRLAGEELVPEGACKPIGALSPILGQSDTIISKYCGEATTWTTATPVVLPGHDFRRGKPCPERIVGRLLKHANISETMVVSVTVEPVARLRGCDLPMQYQRPNHLANYPCRHMSIQWGNSVNGPVSLGAGTGYGLGLFMPLKDKLTNNKLLDEIPGGV